MINTNQQINEFSCNIYRINYQLIIKCHFKIYLYKYYRLLLINYVNKFLLYEVEDIEKKISQSLPKKLFYLKL